MNDVIEYKKTNNLFDDISNIIDEAQYTAYKSVNTILVLRNWLLGKRISEENMGGTRTERYGENIISRDSGVSVPTIWQSRCIECSEKDSIVVSL